MSDFQFTCPRCNRLLKGSDSMLGRVVECVCCNSEILLHSREMQQLIASSSPAVPDRAHGVLSSPPDSAGVPASFQATSSPPRTGGRASCKPQVVRNQTNCISQAEAVRDQIYALFERAALEHGVDVQIVKSPAFTAWPWVSVEAWVKHAQDPALTLRSSATMTIRPKEFCRFPVELDLVVCDDKRSRMWSSIVGFSASDAKDVLSYLLYQRGSMSFNFRRCRTHPLQFWRPKNTSVRLGVDYLSAAQPALYIVGFLTISLAGLGLLLIGIAAVLTFLSRRRRLYVLSTGRPTQEPRNLIRMDSWQTVVNGLGTAQQSVSEAIRAQIASCMAGCVSVSNERIWYWGTDGKEEREQVVARLNRGIAFVHVYRYGEDLYVGWDAHVNSGKWVEQSAGTGYDKKTSVLCSVNTIAAGWHVPTEYDVTDANCLLENVHAAVAKVIKLKLAENHIDQEIDFRILREERQGIAGREQPKAQDHKKNTKGVLSRLRRVG